MSHTATAWRTAVVAVFTASAAWPQNVPSLQPGSLQPGSSFAWRKLGQSAINADLAGLASGPATSVWYSPDGGTLFAKLASGDTYETSDFEHWTRTDASRPDSTPQILIPVSLPEPSRVVAASGDYARICPQHVGVG